MEINALHKEILEGKRCPYCKSSTKLVPGTTYELVGVDFLVACKNFPKCFSFTHSLPNSTQPHGRLANEELLLQRRAAQSQFNKIWLQEHMTKEEALKELSEYIGVPIEYADIAYYNKKNCIRAETWSIKKLYHFQYKKTGNFSVPMTVRNGKRKRITIIKQTGPHTSIVEFDEDEKRMEINTDKIFFYKPKKE